MERVDLVGLGCGPSDENHQSTSSMCTLSTSLFNTVCMISSTLTVIKLSEATLLYAATCPRFRVSTTAPKGCLSRARIRRAHSCLSAGDTDEGGRREAASRMEKRALNGRPMRATSLATRVCGTADVILEGSSEDDIAIKEDRRVVLFRGIVSVVVPTGCRGERGRENPFGRDFPQS
ncbi:hypothetical protein OG21DRAFT_784065 [Imleria badia]|nr:hypothetical protein OG21DRAFT_784065 [Imleria badia]